jgi:hypothetical protein
MVEGYWCSGKGGIGRKGGLSICCRRRWQQRQRVHVTRGSDSEAANDGECAKRGHLNEAEDR